MPMPAIYVDKEIHLVAPDQVGPDGRVLWTRPREITRPGRVVKIAGRFVAFSEDKPNPPEAATERWAFNWGISSFHLGNHDNPFTGRKLRKLEQSWDSGHLYAKLGTELLMGF